MSKINIPVGRSNFADIRGNGYYYIDKSGLIKELLRVFLSFRSVDGLEFAGAYAQLTAVVAELYKEHLYLMDSEVINVIDKELFFRVASKKASQEEIKNSLLYITKIMAVHYGRSIILLIDEYDVPLAKASEKGCYLEMLDVMKGILQAVKDNASLKFAVITGCLRIAKESVFTGTNNFVSDTISDSRLNESAKIDIN